MDITTLSVRDFLERKSLEAQCIAVYVADEGQTYANLERVTWPAQSHSSRVVGRTLQRDPDGDYEVISYAYDPLIHGQRWLKVHLHKVKRNVPTKVPAPLPLQRPAPAARTAKS